MIVQGVPATSHVWIPIALSSALTFAVSTHLKHRSSQDVPSAHTLRLGVVRALISATIRHRLWLLAIGCDAVGLGLQIVALHLGPLSSVQALLVFALVFALLLRQVHERQFKRSETAWALLVSAALAGLIVLARTQPAVTSSLDPGPAIGAAAVLAVFTTGSAVVGRRRQAGARTAALLGATVGGIYATTAALLKQLSNISVHHPLGLLTSWPLYAVIPLGAAGLVLNQIAFRAGPLSASLPTISVVDPLLSMVFGIFVFDERIRTGTLSGIGLGALLIVLVFGVVSLARNAAAAEQAAT